MKGIHHIEVKNRDASFKFDLFRNITVIRGNSGTGKTTLYEMISDYTRLGEASGVNISCDKNCIALIDTDWKNQLEETKDSIVFIDEGAKYLNTKEFAHTIKATDNYYVIFNRESLRELPYSIEEIYEIKTSGKYHSFKKIYKSNKRHRYYKETSPKSNKFDTLITEDTNSGFQFYENYFKNSDIKCYTSGSNSAIFDWLNSHPDKNTLIIADGAAFGSEIDRILKLRTSSNIILCLPESFEWLILKGGFIKDENIEKILESPSSHIESEKYFSWEKFFTELLTEKSAQTPFKYTKKHINIIYLNEHNSEIIISEILNYAKHR